MCFGNGGDMFPCFTRRDTGAAEFGDDLLHRFSSTKKEQISMDGAINTRAEIFFY
jgi:hypothetical protein